VRASLDMIEAIQYEVTVPHSAAEAFAIFAGRLARWWPREFTWAKDVLETIGIEPRTGGLCYERGPRGFRCDWGRVLAWEPPLRLVLAWQISPRREPVPNQALASTVEVRFAQLERTRTKVTLTHRDFERHGEGAQAYRDSMAAPQGWPYIMERFAAAAA
jgi:uncharacterized protein YndB with AHSA1/START domain